MLTRLSFKLKQRELSYLSLRQQPEKQLKERWKWGDLRPARGCPSPAPPSPILSSIRASSKSSPTENKSPILHPWKDCRAVTVAARLCSLSCSALAPRSWLGVLGGWLTSRQDASCELSEEKVLYWQRICSICIWYTALLIKCLSQSPIWHWEINPETGRT